MKTIVSTALLAFAMTCGTAQAENTLPKDVSSCGLDIQARFIESAPRDSFVLENSSTTNWSITSASLKLAPSAGKLIFDTQEGGTGVEAIADFREEKSSAKLRRLSKLRDGGEELMLDYVSFASGEQFTFSIDVDDRLTNSELGQIRVRGGEIDGARFDFTLRGPDGRAASASASFVGTDMRLRGQTCS